MKTAVAMLALLGTLSVAGSALAASTDDVKWINQCTQDNKDEGAKEDVVLKYCTCMTNKMDDNETKSVTQWEKTHVTEQKACSKSAGWK